jgi:hypothetical protein
VRTSLITTWLGHTGADPPPPPLLLLLLATVLLLLGPPLVLVLALEAVVLLLEVLPAPPVPLVPNSNDGYPHPAARSAVETTQGRTCRDMRTGG